MSWYLRLAIGTPIICVFAMTWWLYSLRFAVIDVCVALLIVALIAWYVRAPRAAWSTSLAALASGGLVFAAAEFADSSAGVSWVGATWWAVLVLAGTMIYRWSADITGRIALAAALLLALLATCSPVYSNFYNWFWLPVTSLVGGGVLGVGLILREQRKELVRQNQQVKESIRQELSAELHDVIAHELTGIVVMAEALRAASPKGADHEGLVRIEAAGRRALLHIRSLVAALGDSEQPGTTPYAGSRDDLVRLVEEFDSVSDAQVQLEVDPGARLEGVAGLMTHRVVTEALTNVRRHAATASVVQVRVEQQPQHLVVTITDDGHGGGLGRGGGTGLASLAQRLSVVGGSLVVQAATPGWAVTARVPTKEGG